MKPRNDGVLMVVLGFAAVRCSAFGFAVVPKGRPSRCRAWCCFWRRFVEGCTRVLSVGRYAKGFKEKIRFLF